MSLGVQLFLAVVAFGGTWVALHFFSSRIVDYQEIIKWLEQRDWVRFIKPRIRNFLLQRAWQPLLALIITSFIFSRLETPATFLAEGCFPQAPQFLYLPEPGQDWLDFRTRELTMVGRSQELEDLNSFLNRKGRFSWWWLNGGGGSGKSRLALEWVLSLRRTFIPCVSYGYNAGFFREVVTEDYWKRWQPRRPTLIIIDDAAEHTEGVLNLLGSLGDRAADLEYPVRVLLVERSLPESLKRLNEETRYYTYRYRDKSLTVSPLGSEHLRQMAEELATKRGKPLNLTTQREQKILEISQGLPLLMLVALDSLLESGELRWNTREDLLREQIQRIRAKFLHGGLDVSCLPLLALATFTRGLPWDAARRFQPASVCFNKPLLDRLFQQDTAKAIPSVQPALLGEYFLLEQFGELTDPEREALLKTAWQVAPRDVAITLYNLARDFSRHPQFAALDRLPDQLEAATWWGRVRVGLLFAGEINSQEKIGYLDSLTELVRTYPASVEIEHLKIQGLLNLYASAVVNLRGSDTPVRDTLSRFPPENNQIRDALEIVSQVIRDAPDCCPDVLEIQRARSRILANIIVGYGTIRRWAEVEITFQGLKNIASRFPDDTEVQRALANGAASVNRCYRLEEDKEGIVGRVLRKYEMNRFSGLNELQGTLAAELLNELACYQEEPSAAVREDALQTLKSIAGRFPGDMDIQSFLALGAIHTAAFYVANQQSEAAERTFQTLKSMVDRFPDDIGIQGLWALGLTGTIAFFGMERGADATRRAFETLRSVANRFPDNAAIQNTLALGALGTIVFSGDNHRWEKTQEDAFQALKTAANQFPDDIETQKILAAGAFYVVSHFIKEKHAAEGQAAFLVLKDVAKRFPDNLDIKKMLTVGQELLQQYQ